MRLGKLLGIGALAAATAMMVTGVTAGSALAQPSQGAGYAPPTGPPPEVRTPYRSGLTFGFDLGLGSMTADGADIECFGCDYDPVSFGLSGYIGGMINPRLALLGRLGVVGRPLDANGTEILWNTSAMVAARLWLTRVIWLEGGLGFSAIGITFDDGFFAEDEQLDEGGIGMIGIGFEVLHSRRFAIDISLTATSARYDDLDDTINTGLINIGFSWYPRGIVGAY